jgi:flagellar motor protein MotB
MNDGKEVVFGNLVCNVEAERLGSELGGVLNKAMMGQISMNDLGVLNGLLRIPALNGPHPMPEMIVSPPDAPVFPDVPQPNAPAFVPPISYPDLPTAMMVIPPAASNMSAMKSEWYDQVADGFIVTAEVEDLKLTDAKVIEDVKAGGGKAVRFDKKSSSAVGSIKLDPGFYVVKLIMKRGGDESDAVLFDLTHFPQFRVIRYGEGFGPVHIYPHLDLAKAENVEISIAVAETGAVVDRVEFIRLKKEAADQLRSEKGQNFGLSEIAKDTSNQMNGQIAEEIRREQETEKAIRESNQAMAMSQELATRFPNHPFGAEGFKFLSSKRTIGNGGSRPRSSLMPAAN